MKYCIIVRGPLGVGKTTIAKELASELHGQYISVDDILKKKHLDVIKGKSIPLGNFLKANGFVLKAAKGKTVIFDGNFYYKKQLSDLIKKLGVKVYVFTLKAPLKTCVQRDAKRKKPCGEDAAKDVYSLVTKFDYGVSIDAACDIDQVVRSIIRHLP